MRPLPHPEQSLRRLRRTSRPCPAGAKERSVTLEKFVIRGGNPLSGEVTIGGAKNAAVAILPATILAGGKCIIENLPCISDVMASLQILSELGADIRMISKSTYEIDTSRIDCTEVSNELSRQMRASYYFLGALLGRFGAAQVAMPGGCNLGPRPIDQHLKAFTALGAEDSVEYGMIRVTAGRLQGAHVFFDTVSVGATMNAMLAAVNGYQEFCGNPQGKAKPPKCQRRVFCDAGRELSRAEYFRLLAAARQSGRKRTLLVLQTLCATGIRVSELRCITAEAVRKGRAAIRCKGKCREILLPAELCKRLERWCRRQRIHAGPLFLTRTGRPLNRITVWKMLKALCERAGVAREKLFPHNLRHLFARTFYALEKNLSKLADLLGHSSIETTRIYIMESGAEHQKLLERMHLLL